ncbi:radical SAM protein [Desulfobacter vibrioformis]|uniref:radical SAM protein n=1 Tax=Desulfobacter vibrioformis TaxID=34031 RepID=UPI0005504A56|nr:radical SAM protein [Desulfobacter vibrioformis]
MKILKLPKYAQIFGSLARARFTGKPVPFMLEYQITQVCNLKCKYCYAELETLHSEKDPTLQEIKDNIDEFHSMGTRVLRLLGGEPLMRNDIGDILEHCRKLGLFVEMSTNATMIHKRIDALKLVDILQISIDGDRGATDNARGRGLYNRIIKGVENALGHGLPVRLHGVYNSFSMAGAQESPVKHLAELGKKYGVPFNFCPFVADFSGEKRGAYVSLGNLMKYHQECIDLKAQGYPYFNSDAALHQLVNWPDLSKDFYMESERHLLPKNCKRCLGGEMYCFLDSDGSLYPCVPLWKRGLNINEVGIQSAWEYLQDVRKEARCWTCASLGDIEFSRTLSLDVPSMVNTLKKVLMLGGQ